MLDLFLEVACGRTKQAQVEAKNLELLDKLPTATLLDIANGDLLKTASYPGDSSGSCWLEQFKGTPLLDEAIAIEKEELQLQMQNNERRQAEQAARASFPTWEDESVERDQIALRRKLLELELAGADTTDVGGQEGEDVDAPPMEEAAGEGAPPAAGQSGLNPRFTEEGNRGKDPGAEVDDPRTDPSEADGTPFDALHQQAAKESPPNFDPAKMMDGLSQPPKPKPKVTEKTTERTIEKDPEEKVEVKQSSAEPDFEDLRVKMAHAFSKAKGLGRVGQLLSGSRAKALSSATGAAGKATEQAAGAGRKYMANARAGRELRLGRMATEESRKVTGTRAAAGAAAVGAGLAASGATKKKEASAEELARAAGVDYDKTKQAFMGALQAGLKGIGQFAQTAGKSVATAARTGGMPAAGQAAANAGRSGLTRAGNFIQKNPGAGAALVAAPAAAAGYAAGRQ